MSGRPEKEIPLMILVGSECGGDVPEIVSGRMCIEIKLRAPDVEERRQLWIFFAEEIGVEMDPGLDLERISSIYKMTPGQMKQVIGMAAAQSFQMGGERVLRAEQIEENVNRLCNRELLGYAYPIRNDFSWNDLFVEESAKRKLRQVCERMRCQYQVKERWGFKKKLPYGNGMVILLYGPPGTGKTMAAQILAREMGLYAYRVDISRILDKYIGETEKKIAALFDAAQNSNALLFFDEADALFAKRTEVSDSKDKHSNAETSYLLQRMEEHDGVSILSTNAVQNMDEAFRRRIHVMIHMPMPGPSVRGKLWEKVFPDKIPVAEDILPEEFGRRFELNGSQIKNIALQAAFRAASSKTPVTRELLMEAIKDEYEKNGRIITEE
jgi:SpoVK/Ycf46/Vps4 family AAA+-type ATPase